MKFKNAILFFCLLQGVIIYGQQGQKNFIDQPYIEVVGQFEIEVIPDEIYLTILLNENDKKGKNDLEKQESQMIQALKSLGIDVDKKLTIQDYDGTFKKYVLYKDRVNKIKKYQLILSSGKKLGEVYNSLSKINISNISIKKVSHSKIEEYKRETKINALKIAKEKAQEYASAINQSLGKAIFIKENPSSNYSSMLEGVANGIQLRGTSSEQAYKIYDLNIQPIQLTAIVQTKFILN
jgi:hypothetical protein